MSVYRPSLDRLVGQSGVVVETIPGDHAGLGVVKVAGQLWSAATDWTDTLEPGTVVLVMARTSYLLEVLPERR